MNQFFSSSLEFEMEEIRKSTYRLGFLQTLPWIEMDKNGVPFGAIAHMINDVARSMNFTYELVSSKIMGWGSKQPDGNWTGLIGMLQSDESDMIVIPTAASSTRIEVVDFSFPIYTGTLMILSGGKAQESNDDMFGYLTAFNKEVWLAIFLSVISMVSTATLADKLFSKNRTNTISTWFGYSWDYLAAFFSEASPRDPRSGIPRFMLITWCISVLTLMNAFSGQLKSSLTVRKEVEQIDSLADLAKQRSQRILVWKGSAFEDLLRRSPLDAMKMVCKQVIKTNGFVVVKDMYTAENYKEVVKGKTVLLTEDSTLKYYLGIMCQGGKGGSVHLAKESVISVPIYWAMSKRLPRTVKDEINKRLYIYYETGLMWKWMNEMYKDYERCIDKDDADQEEKNLGLNDMIAIFLLWGTFLALSVIVFLAELISPCSRCTKTRKRKSGNVMIPK